MALSQGEHGGTGRDDGVPPVHMCAKNPRSSGRHSRTDQQQMIASRFRLRRGIAPVIVGRWRRGTQNAGVGGFVVGTPTGVLSNFRATPGSWATVGVNGGLGVSSSRPRPERSSTTRTSWATLRLIRRRCATLDACLGMIYRGTVRRSL